MERTIVDVLRKDGTPLMECVQQLSAVSYTHLYFIQYIKEHHPECTTLKSARKYVNEWLQARADQGLSAWTVQLSLIHI